MIGWDHLVEMKRIEKLSLLAFPTTHHAPLPQMTYLKESRIASRLNESFATLSASQRTWLDFPQGRPCSRTGRRLPRPVERRVRQIKLHSVQALPAGDTLAARNLKRCRPTFAVYCFPTSP